MSRNLATDTPPKKTPLTLMGTRCVGHRSWCLGLAWFLYLGFSWAGILAV